ncbi:MAG: phosphoribosyltransferase [Clostridia bacterium]|nr:phosphoribosyltransferase [Clostridia bacterium]
MSEQRIKFNIDDSFEIYLSEIEAGNLSLLLKDEFRTKEWAVSFGIIQSYIENGFYKYNNDQYEIKKIIIDMRDLEWVDPIPFINLILTLYSFKKSKEDRELAFYLPSDSEDNKRKLLKYIAQEGFLKQLICIGDVYFNKSKCDDDTIEKMKLYDIELSFNRCQVFPLKIINPFEIGDIDNYITKEMNNIRHALQQKKLTYTQVNSLTHKIKLILVELVQNIREHAYPGEKKGFGSIYIRYREGYNYKMDSDQKEKLKKRIDEEHIHNPLLTKNFFYNNPQFIELYVVDNGIGYSNTVVETKNNVYPLRESFRKTFIQGHRGKTNNKEFKSEKGGHSLIYQLLSQNKDFIWIKDINEYLGTYCYEHDNSTLDSQKKFYENDYASSLKSKSVQCFAFLARLRIVKDDYEKYVNQETNSEYYTKEAANLQPYVSNSFIKTFETEKFSFKPDLDKLMKIYADEKHILNIKKSIKQREIYFKDSRFENIESNRDEDLLINYRYNPSSTKNYILLPKTNQSKMSVYQSIDDFLGESENEKIKLVVADISTEDFYVFISALNNVKFFRNSKTFSFPKKVEKIVLVSKRLSICILERNYNVSEGEYAFSIDETEMVKFMDGNTEEESEFSVNSVYHLLALLKYYDSHLLWNSIKNSSSQESSLYVNEEIIWDENKKPIKGYINFPQLVSESLCLELFRVALERSTIIFNSNNVYFKNVDHMTKRIVYDLNVNTEINDDSNIINVGSVYMSGKTETDNKDIKVKNENSVNIYFFKHPESIMKVNSLFLWPQQDWIDKTMTKPFHKENAEKLKRIGKTPMIAPDGQKYFLRSLRRDIDGNTPYRRNLVDSYNSDYQRLSTEFIRLGHIEYNGNHDFVFIDIVNEFKSSFYEQGHLAAFLISEIYIALGNNERDMDEYLSDMGKEKWKSKIIQYIADHYSEKGISESNKSDMIVYLSQHNTDVIMQIVKQVFNKKIHDKIIALVPIKQGRDGSSFLISPLTLDVIEKRLSQSQIGRVIIFDDIIVSGRTRKELKHVLTSLKAKSVHTLSLIDRQRLPIYAPYSERHRSYWRTDIPRLSTRNLCVLCNSILLVNNFKRHLASNMAKERIDYWIEAWGKVDSMNIHSNHGLRQRSINLKQGFFEHSDGQSVEIKTDIGMFLYCSEMLSLISEDNTITDIIANNPELKPEDIILLVGSILILYGFGLSSNSVYEMLVLLIESLYKIKDINNYTALAALVLIGQQPDTISSILTKFNEVSFSLTNFDFWIVLSYFSKNHVRHIKDSINNDADRLLLCDREINNFYNNFNFELYHKGGKRHNRPIIDFVDTLKSKKEYETGCKMELHSIVNLLNSLDLVKDCLINIPVSYYYIYKNYSMTNADKVINPRDYIRDRIQEIESFIEKLRNRTNILKEYKEVFAIEKDDVVSMLEDIEKLYLSFINDIYQWLFISVDTEAEKMKLSKELLKQKLQVLIDKKISSIHKESSSGYNARFCKIDVNFPQDGAGNIINSAYSYYFDNLIAYEVENLLTDIRHSQVKKHNPVDKSDSDMANLWIYVKVRAKALYIEFYYNYSRDVDEINQIKEGKKRYSEEHLEELGGKIRHKRIVRNREEYLRSQMIIPALRYK